MIALIDGDILTYSIPFAMQENIEVKGCKVPILKEPENAEFVLEKRLYRFIKDVLEGSGCDDYKIFLSGKTGDKEKDNFRYQYKPNYKAGRGAKPLLHEAAREVLIQDHLAIVSDKGMEADDLLALEGRDNPDTCICSIDKDLLQVPGNHYRWGLKRKGVIIREPKLIHQDRWNGLKELYSQALIGDKADNIQGIHGIGEVKAKKLLEVCETEHELYNTVLHEYTSSYGEENGYQFLMGNMRCLRLTEELDEEGYPIPWESPR